ncbi:ABC transporter substrate-binding protein [Streptomyces sp. HNM0645]|uniref:ABC transporter substrate-binding protein n=1 Tax=Streptomyces sp. HNM0645 TaxID=2782343 RepID=UPI0024B7905A|nr:ABC transporter substrate-binding protein [Streptomyces sp. HNM0645]MDI9883129.1 ABC transporter substrate-binding protein [Streptomyces sp. HNM0645]
MNRKALVLPALMGLLAPVLAACGTTPGAPDGGNAIVVGTTDRFVVDSGSPAPFDPAFAYDTGAEGEALESGEIDMMARAVSPEQIRDLREHPKDGVELSEVPGLEIRYLGFNTDHPSVEDKAVRQAMASVVDRGEIVSNVYGATAEPLHSLIPTSITGHTNAFFERYGEPDRRRAARVLDEVGVATPEKLTLHCTTDHYGSGTAKEFAALRDQLNATDLSDVTVKGTDWSECRPAQKRGDYAVYGLGWFPDFPDPDNYIAPFLDEDNFLNTPYVSTAARNQLIPESRRKADRSAAALPFARLRDIVATDVPVLPLWQGKQHVAARSDVNGVEWTLNASSDLQLWELERGTA